MICQVWESHLPAVGAAPEARGLRRGGVCLPCWLRGVLGGQGEGLRLDSGVEVLEASCAGSGGCGAASGLGLVCPQHGGQLGVGGSPWDACEQKV